MTPRRQPDPSYLIGKTYPAKEAQESFDQLADYFEKASRSLHLVAKTLSESSGSGDELTDETGNAIRIALSQAEEARRLWVEFVTRNQFRTQRELADLLGDDVSASRIYKWRYDPLDTTRLTPSTQPE